MVATIMAAGRRLGYSATLELWEGGVNLTGELASPLMAMSYVALAAGLGGLAFQALRRGRAYDDKEALVTACLAVAGSVIVSKVFSPQYLIWAIPLLLLASVELCRTRRARCIASAALLAIAALTSWLFPHHYFTSTSAPCPSVWNRYSCRATASRCHSSWWASATRSFSRSSSR